MPPRSETSAMIQNISQKLDLFRKDLDDSMNALKGEVNELRSLKREMDDIKASLAQKDQMIEQLANELAEVKIDNKRMANLIDDEDAYVRRESLIFSGSMISNSDRNENCSSFIREKIKKDEDYSKAGRHQCHSSSGA